MVSKFWSFVEACDDTHSVRAVTDLLAEVVRSLEFDAFAILTHAPAHDLRSLGVFAHNWPQEAVDHLLAGRRDGRSNPLFEAVERTLETVHWSAGEWRATLNKGQQLWLDRLSQIVRGGGASRAIKTPLLTASCSITSQGPLQPDRIRTCMRVATYAFHQIQFLQRPELSESDKLTAREHECLYRAAVHGERPRTVARQLGVKVSTIRTLRQKANGRLDAASAEQAVWRMLETGQLFRPGRTSKPRSW